MSLIYHYFSKASDNLNWMFNAMDITQWAIVSVVMVTLGFIAIKFR